MTKRAAGMKVVCSVGPHKGQVGVVGTRNVGPGFVQINYARDSRFAAPMSKTREATEKEVQEMEEEIETNIVS